MKELWSDECTAALKAPFDAGVPFGKIAKDLNDRFGAAFTGSAVFKKAVRMGWAKRGKNVLWPAEHDAALIELYNAAESPSFTDIAISLNKKFDTAYSKSAVVARAGRLKLSGKKPASSANRRPRAAVERKPRIRISTATELPALYCVETVSRKLTFAELEDNDCRFPEGDNPSEYRFCGNPKFTFMRFDRPVKSSYCRACFEITRKIEEPRRRAPRGVGVAA